MTRARWWKLIGIIAGWCSYWGLEVVRTAPPDRASYLVEIGLVSALGLPFVWLKISTWRTEREVARMLQEGPTPQNRTRLLQLLDERHAASGVQARLLGVIDEWGRELLEIRRRNRGPVERRAYDLLDSHLTPQQRADWCEHAAFTVIGSQGRQYTLNANYAFNVLSGDSMYCARPGSDVPQGDVLLAQKLLLESDEAAFLAVANRELRLPEYP